MIRTVELGPSASDCVYFARPENLPRKKLSPRRQIIQLLELSAYRCSSELLALFGVDDMPTISRSFCFGLCGFRSHRTCVDHTMFTYGMRIQRPGAISCYPTSCRSFAHGLIKSDVSAVEINNEIVIPLNTSA